MVAVTVCIIQKEVKVQDEMDRRAAAGEDSDARYVTAAAPFKFLLL